MVGRDMIHPPIFLVILQILPHAEKIGMRDDGFFSNISELRRLSDLLPFH
jgi:hypothetical protein